MDMFFAYNFFIYKDTENFVTNKVFKNLKIYNFPYQYFALL